MVKKQRGRRLRGCRNGPLTSQTSLTSRRLILGCKGLLALLNFVPSKWVVRQRCAGDRRTGKSADGVAVENTPGLQQRDPRVRRAFDHRQTLK